MQHNPPKYQYHRFAADGANYSINTDDPLVTDTVLSDEYKFVTSKIQLTDEDVLKAVS